MQIENLNIEVRPRTGWQALDLGVLLAQRWYVPLLICFALPLSAVIVVSLLLLPDSPTLATALVWWLKPLYERIPLSFLSTAIFGEVPTVRQALRRWRSCVLPGLLPALTYLRLSPTRSFKAPIYVLEGLQGRAQQKRFQVLNASHGSEATWLTILCVHVEGFLNLGLMAFAVMFIPEELLGDIWEAYLGGLSTIEMWASNVFYFVSLMLIGPFYVATGFALYINRRVELEAWDIELGFTKILRRLAHTLVIAACIGCAQLHFATPAYAQSTAPAEQSKAAITEVLESEQYHQTETFRYPQFLENWEWETDPESNDEPWDLNWIAVLLELSLWTLGIALVIWVIYRLRLLEKLTTSSAQVQQPSPDRLFGVPLDTPSLPKDILQAADERWQSGDQRAALSLLLRGWLMHLIKNFDCRFQEGDTEADCLRTVKAHTKADTHQRFYRLLMRWQQVAYAHQIKPAEHFNELRDDWNAQWTQLIE